MSSEGGRDVSVLRPRIHITHDVLRTLHATSLLPYYKMEIKINRNANKKENIYGIVLEEREIFANFATNKILFVVR